MAYYSMQWMTGSEGNLGAENMQWDDLGKSLSLSCGKERVANHS